MARVILLPGKEKRLLAGHLWVYEGEIKEVEGEVEPGGIVSVCSSKGKFLGRGYFNPYSQITVRLLTREDEEINESFLRRRLEAALAFRQRVVKGASAYRLVNGEGDLLPGLVVDRYGDYLVVQILTLGMEKLRPLLLPLLVELLSPRGIYERSDVSSREKEGLPLATGLLHGEVPRRVTITEGEFSFLVDIYEGQKTGFFLDQRENRQILSTLTAGCGYSTASATPAALPWQRLKVKPKKFWRWTCRSRPWSWRGKMLS
nr:hypothetical protein [Ammonifex thiophilus]